MAALAVAHRRPGVNLDETQHSANAASSSAHTANSSDLLDSRQPSSTEVCMRVIGLVLALGLTLAPLAAQAQPPAKVYRISLFHVGLDHVPPSLDGLRDGLKALGYEEGKNLQLDFRNLPDEAAARVTANEFARARPDLVVAFENQTIRAAHEMITDIPVVFLHVTDPVAAGVVKSLGHPGGNMTGLVALGNAPLKEVQLFKEIVPGLHRMLVLADPDDPGVPQFRREVQQVASALKITTVERDARTQVELEQIFVPLSRSNTDGVFIASLNLRVKFHSVILRLATKQRLPVAGHRSEWVEQGALFSYAENIREVWSSRGRALCEQDPQGRQTR